MRRRALAAALRAHGRALWDAGLSARLVAEQVGVPVATVRYWRQRYGWPDGTHQGDASADRGHGYRALIGKPHGATTRGAARVQSRVQADG